MSLTSLRKIIEAPTWSKEIVVWIGNRETVNHALGGLNQVEIDLLELLPEDDSLPTSREERAELLDRELDKRLQNLKPEGSDRVVLRVRNAALLARYRLGLQRFFDWFAGTHTLTILEIDWLRPITLPSSVAGVMKFDPNWLPDYFRPLLAKPDRLLIEVA